MPDILFFITFIAFLSLTYTSNKNALHMFQQNHYELRRYTKWLFEKYNLKFSLTTGLYLIILFILSFISIGKYVGLVLTIVYSIYLYKKEEKKQYIKPLVVTQRVERQIVVLVAFNVFFILIASIYMNIFALGLFSIVLPYLLIYFMGILTYPIEELIKKGFENEARKIIRSNPNLIKVGITGSYGKTSTKNIVNDIISNSFYTLMTPASYNTPMGITRTIREMLKPIHEVFICEMGADKVKDISYLMDFVQPKYGIVTSIGPQHLATFNTMDNIVHEKMQEIEKLPIKGVGFINLDNEYIANYKINNICKVISVGIDNKKANYVAKDIKYTSEGTTFTVKIKNRKYKFKTSLLGKHNITNILLGIALAIELNIDIKTIVKSVSRIQQVEHRLQVKTINGFTFIDDAFNANPVGSKMSIDVLSNMKGKRVVVTPGMIDLGSKQDEMNKEFGSYMKDKVDFVILVGQQQTVPILEGLKEANFNEKKILVVSNVKEAFDYVYRHFTSKDTILLENDLPDAFNR